ncbi:MAG TPA: universal stress protein [Acidobacteriota bacterium]|nr:universal stress protein [Acidobacteriota bacterium]
MIDTIIFATDFSGASRKTLQYAGRLARRAKARIIGAHALKPPSSLYSQPPEKKRQWEEEHKSRLSTFMDSSHLRGLKVESVLVSGSPQKALSDLARREKADLVLVSKRSRSTIEKFFVGSVTEILVGQLPCPVLVVPDEGANTADWNPILCPYDFSHNSRLALEYSAKLANSYDCPLTVLHVEAGEMDAAEARQKCQEAVTIYNAPDSTRVMVISNRRPAHTIVETAQKIGSDLVVLGRRGNNEGDYVGAGTTAHQVLREETFPLLIVPPLGV